MKAPCGCDVLAFGGPGKLDSSNCKYTEVTRLICPRVHLNGDRASDLTEPIAEAYSAIATALEALAQTSPNARNYYVIGPEAFSLAVEQHRLRMQHLETVKAQLLLIHEAIQRNEIYTEVEK